MCGHARVGFFIFCLWLTLTYRRRRRRRQVYEWGYARIDAVNGSYLAWEFVDSASRQVVDRMAIWQVRAFKSVGPHGHLAGARF